MYGNAAQIRALAKNRISSLSDDEIAEAAVVVDAEIDGAVSDVYYWPVNEHGVDISGSAPQLMVTIANYLTAAVIEQQSFAHNADNEAQLSPLGARLDRTGRAMLAKVVDGTYHLPLSRVAPLSGATSSTCQRRSS